MNTDTVIAITDLSAGFEASLERAAHLAAHNRWGLRLMYAPEQNMSIEPGPLARLGLCARQLARRHNVAVEAASHIVVSAAQLADATRSARLVVTGKPGDTGPWSFWKTTIVDQLMRNAHCPVLVVKTPPEGAYRRMLVGVDFGEYSRQLVKQACEIVTESEVHLFHALARSGEARLRASDASIHSIKAYRRQVNSNAEERLVRLADSLETRRNRVMFFVGYGDAALQTSVQQEAVSADLVVVGRPARSFLAEMFLGSTSRRLVRIAASDVLVVPQRSESGRKVESRRAVLP